MILKWQIDQLWLAESKHCLHYSPGGTQSLKYDKQRVYCLVYCLAHGYTFSYNLQSPSIRDHPERTIHTHTLYFFFQFGVNFKYEDSDTVSTNSTYAIIQFIIEINMHTSFYTDSSVHTPNVAVVHWLSTTRWVPIIHDSIEYRHNVTRKHSLRRSVDEICKQTINIAK